MSLAPPPETFLATYLGARAEQVRDVQPLNHAKAAKNQVIRFTLGDETFVLKVFRHDWAYRLSLIKTPLVRRSRAFKLRATAATRVQAEVDAEAAYRAAGLGVFEIVERPAPEALVFRHYDGQTARQLLLRRDDPAFTTTLVERIAEDFARRQALAVERNDRGLIHPDPGLKHTWVTPSGELLQFDFEGRVNPSLLLEEALAREMEVFVFQVGRSELVSDDDMARLVGRLGPDVRERWRRQSASPSWGRNRGNRRRLADVAAFMG